MDARNACHSRWSGLFIGAYSYLRAILEEERTFHPEFMGVCLPKKRWRVSTARGHRVFMARRSMITRFGDAGQEQAFQTRAQHAPKLCLQTQLRRLSASWPLKSDLKLSASTCYPGTGLICIPFSGLMRSTNHSYSLAKHALCFTIRSLLYHGRIYLLIRVHVLFGKRDLHSLGLHKQRASRAFKEPEFFEFFQVLSERVGSNQRFSLIEIDICATLMMKMTMGISFWLSREIYSHPRRLIKINVR